MPFSPFSFSSGSSSTDSDYFNATDTYFWGCTLTRDRPSVEWSYNSEAGERHSLVLKQSVLGTDAVMNQRNVVQVETLNFSNERVHLPLLSLTLGRNDMCSMDVNFDSDNPVTFRLVEGSGPVHVAAEHLVEYDEDEDDDSDADVRGNDKCPMQKPSVSIQRSSSSSILRPPSLSTNASTLKRPALPLRVSSASSLMAGKLDGFLESVTSSTACQKVEKPMKSMQKPLKPRKPRAKKSPVAKKVAIMTPKPRATRKSPKKKTTAGAAQKAKTKTKPTVDRRKSCAL